MGDVIEFDAEKHDSYIFRAQEIIGVIRSLYNDARTKGPVVIRAGEEASIYLKLTVDFVKGMKGNTYDMLPLIEDESLDSNIICCSTDVDSPRISILNLRKFF